eukprot:scaffold306_cov525-Prasinococcus_capsulatus_cf.AAC.51
MQLAWNPASRRTYAAKVDACNGAAVHLPGLWGGDILPDSDLIDALNIFLASAGSAPGGFLFILPNRTMPLSATSQINANMSATRLTYSHLGSQV